MKCKELNKFEYIGLVAFLSEHLSVYLIGLTLWHSSLTNTINFTNSYISSIPREMGKLGAVGLTEGNDVVFEFWNDEEEECKRYWVDYGSMQSTFPKEWQFKLIEDGE